MKELLVRTLTSLIFVAALVFAVLSQAAFAFGLFLLFVLFGAQEYGKLLHRTEELPPSFEAFAVIFASAAYLLPGIAFLLQAPLLLWALPLLVPLALISELAGKRERPFRNAALKLFGPLYFGLSFACLIGLRHHEAGGPYLLLGVLMLVWVHDAAAYLLGKLLGRHKLWPRISPGKTWEGSASGAFFTFLLSGLLAHYNFPQWGSGGMLDPIVIAFPASVILFGTLGDLSISLFKRSTGVKDTGQLLPGHGGVLDRFDALLMVAPFLLFILELSSS